jgi:SAM-dependent methyltransferase
VTEAEAAQPVRAEGRARSRFTEAVAREYDAARALPEDVLEAIRLRIVESTGIGPGSIVLEAGAGTGALSNALLRTGCRYVGFDASIAMLRRFRQGHASRGALAQADLSSLPVWDATFDAVCAFRVFGVVPGWRRGVGECLRVLRPGGLLVVGGLGRAPGSLHAFIREERNRLLADAGLETGRPGGNDDAILAALGAAGDAMAAIEPVAWSEATTPLRQIERNLSGWRIQALSENEREQLRTRLTAAVGALYGSLDTPLQERVAFVLHAFRKRAHPSSPGPQG